MKPSPTKFYLPNNALHPIRALDTSQRLSYKERHTAAIASEGSTEVIADHEEQGNNKSKVDKNGATKQLSINHQFYVNPITYSQTAKQQILTWASVRSLFSEGVPSLRPYLVICEIQKIALEGTKEHRSADKVFTIFMLQFIYSNFYSNRRLFENLADHVLTQHTHGHHRFNGLPLFLMLNSIPKFTLNNGVKIPSLGLGTYQIRKPEAIDLAVRSAVASGYRLIDSAIGYRNEDLIGKTVNELIQDSSLGLTREDFFITSKLGPKDQGYDNCLKAFSGSIKRFGTDYLDLFLIHWPGTQKFQPTDPQNAESRKGSWKAMEELYKEGKIRAIGVSNYTLKHLTELLSYCTVPPTVMQFELHPLLYQKDLIDFCKQNNIHIQAYSSLGEGELVSGEIIPVISQIAKTHKVTPAQVLLRWGYQHDAILIPKSVTPERIKENANIFHFELSQEV
ncbi:15963_t:CDS:10 [Acaulospora morrowiae]|uniref:15963_t:CDS:1 n=1 Tax=Acaulospora morrowiae TaxID=94023 RepID=A0A9N8YRZ3_9GLOM|nr:15963_t:CDS:10 [Acaulospora morrowiae]